jgi:hypothetical protein
MQFEASRTREEMERAAWLCRINHQLCNNSLAIHSTELGIEECVPPTPWPQNVKMADEITLWADRRPQQFGQSRREMRADFGAKSYHRAADAVQPTPSSRAKCLRSRHTCWKLTESMTR